MAKRGTHIEVSADTSKYERAMRDMRRTTKQTTDVIKTSWLKAAGAVYGVIKAWDVAKLAARAKQEQASFRNLSASYGVNANKIIADLKRASGQAIDTMTLIQKAGTAMMMGIAPDKLSRLMAIARATSRQTGQTVSKSFEDIALAVGRQSKMILDNLGIIVNTQEANEKYAKSLNKTAAQLTDAEKKQAFLNATLEAGEEIMGRLGNQGTTAAETFERVSAAAKDIKLAVGTLLLPVLKQMAEYLLNAANYWRQMFSTDAMNTLEKQRDAVLKKLRVIDMATGGMSPADKEAPGYRVIMERRKMLNAQLKTITKSIQNYDKIPYETLPPLNVPGGGGSGGGKPKTKFDLLKEIARLRESQAGVPPDILRIISTGTSGGPMPRRQFYEPYIGRPDQPEFWGLQEAPRKVVEEAKSTFSLMDTLARNTARSMQDSFSNFFFDAMQGKLKSLGDYVKGFVGAVQRSIASIMAQKMVSAIGSYMPFLKIHQGGVVGGAGIPRVMMPAMLLAGAGRYHNGLRPDEFPAILQRGERVIPRGGGGSGDGGGPIVYNDLRGSQFLDQETLYKTYETISAAQVAKHAPAAVINNYEMNGPIRDLIRSAR